MNAVNRLTSGKRTLEFDINGPFTVQVFEGKKLIQTLTPKAEFKWACFDRSASTVFVGARNILTYDVVTGKQGKLVLKGHKACANALVIDPDGKRLYSAGGSYSSSNDRMVRAFDTATGKLLWQAGGKKAGFLHMVVNDNRLFVTCENGSVYLLTRDGKIEDEKVIGPGATPINRYAWDGLTFTDLACVKNQVVVTWYVSDGPFHKTVLGLDAKKKLVVGATKELS